MPDLIGFPVNLTVPVTSPREVELEQPQTRTIAGRVSVSPTMPYRNRQMRVMGDPPDALGSSSVHVRAERAWTEHLDQRRRVQFGEECGGVLFRRHHQSL